MRRWVLAAVLLLGLTGMSSWGQTIVGVSPLTNAAPFNVNLGIQGIGQPQEIDSAIKILFSLTLLTVAPTPAELEKAAV